MENYPIDFVKWVVFASTEVRKQEAITSANCFFRKCKGKEILKYLITVMLS